MILRHIACTTMKQVFCIFATILLLVAGVAAAPDPSKPIPGPEVLQAALWRNMELQDFRLEGVMRTAKSLHPLVLKTKERLMVYEFQKQPLQIRVELTIDGSFVQRRTKSSEAWKPLTDRQKLETILDSDVAYEDLGVDFLRWGDVRPLGRDSIKTLGAWAYEARTDRPSTYAKAHFWISSDYLAVLRVDAFNEKNQVIKRVEVNGVQQVGKSYVIKEMMISSLIPGRELSKTRTYLEIRDAKPGSGL
jgi:hypothetical protein